MRYFAEIAYKGTAYSGWQVQPNGVSVQQKMDEALQTIWRDSIHCIGCGRTDAGVHAEQFFLHFDTHAPEPPNVLKRLNGCLPDDISVQRVFPVAENAHARFDAKMRAYEYRMVFGKEIFRKDLVYFRPYNDLDFSIMQDACSVIVRHSDFASFCKSKQGSKTTIVHIKEMYWKRDRDVHILYISADRFLRGMVRLIMGAMIQLGRHRMTLEELDEGISNKKRFKYALSAPASGLFLTKVEY